MEYNINDLPENIRNNLLILDVHWIWTGTIANADRKDKKGILRYNGKNEYAHRFVFHLLTGFDLNNGLQVNHQQDCGISLCCNPNCLYAGTQLDNVSDIIRVRKTHCNFGHPLAYSPTTGHGYCQTCKNKRRDEWRQRKRE